MSFSFSSATLPYPNNKKPARNREKPESSRRKHTVENRPWISECVLSAKNVTDKTPPPVSHKLVDKVFLIEKWLQEDDWIDIDHEDKRQNGASNLETFPRNNVDKVENDISNSPQRHEVDGIVTAQFNLNSVRTQDVALGGPVQLPVTASDDSFFFFFFLF